MLPANNRMSHNYFGDIFKHIGGLAERHINAVCLTKLANPVQNNSDRGLTGQEKV